MWWFVHILLILVFWPALIISVPCHIVSIVKRANAKLREMVENTAQYKKP